MDLKRKKPNRKSTPMKLKNGSPSSMLMVEMDTSVPLQKLREIVGLQLCDGRINDSEIFLQDIQLDPALSLYHQGVKVSGNVELSIQWEHEESNCRLTIVEIAKNVTDQELKALNGAEQKQIDNSAGNKALSCSDTLLSKEGDDDTAPSIPNNPTKWTSEHVHLWMTWIAKGYNLDLGVIKNTEMDGKTLCSLSIEEFFVKFPYGNIFWSHLSLLKRNEPNDLFSSTDCSAMVNLPLHNQLKSIDNDVETSSPKMVVQIDEPIDTPYYTVSKRTSSSNSRPYIGGQTQLWQFLLELLTDADERNVIRWVGDEGEFKFLNPEKVAQKWGARKGKPAMNYEKLSRALRYYYDGEMISKVSGKRFQYKFVCNLKEILGFDAAELNRMVVECSESRHANENA